MILVVCAETPFGRFFLLLLKVSGITLSNSNDRRNSQVGFVFSYLLFVCPLKILVNGVFCIQLSAEQFCASPMMVLNILRVFYNEKTFKLRLEALSILFFP